MTVPFNTYEKLLYTNTADFCTYFCGQVNSKETLFNDGVTVLRCPLQLPSLVIPFLWSLRMIYCKLRTQIQPDLSLRNSNG